MTNLSEAARALIATRLRKRSQAPSNSGMNLLPEMDRERDGLPASFAQEAIWLAQQLSSTAAEYNCVCAFTIRGLLDVSALEQALQEIVRRHEILRCSFRLASTGLIQVRHNCTLRLEKVRLPELTRDALMTHISGLGSQPFSLPDSGLLLRAYLIEIANQEHVFVFNTHHIVCDGASMGVVAGELERLYESYASNTASPLPELEVQYGDYALWQRRLLGGRPLEDQIDYWQKQLGGLSPLQFPIEKSRPDRSRRTAERTQFVL